MKPTLRGMRRILCSTLVVALGAMAVEAVAVVVAPTAVVLSDARPAGAISLYNPSARPEEVSVEAVFGYPTTDERGGLYLLLDEEGGDTRAASGWIEALPRRLVVPPGERRTVRLLGRPPAGIPEGEYWSRLVVTSRGQRLPVGGVTDSSSVQVGLDLEVRTIIALTYRKGEVTTGVDVHGFAPEMRSDSLVFRPDLKRRGNGAYIGLMEVLLTDEAGEEVGRWREQVAVYRTYHRRYAYDVASLPPGRYQLRLRLSTEREDVPAGDRLDTEPLTVSAAVTKP